MLLTLPKRGIISWKSPFAPIPGDRPWLRFVAWSFIGGAAAAGFAALTIPADLHINTIVGTGRRSYTMNDGDKYLTAVFLGLMLEGIAAAWAWARFEKFHLAILGPMAYLFSAAAAILAFATAPQ